MEQVPEKVDLGLLAIGLLGCECAGFWVTQSWAIGFGWRSGSPLRSSISFPSGFSR
jgi:hypothetical protein